MTRSLLIAPQWIGDAVMSQPLLARLAARGELLTVAALPWVAPVYRAMAAVDEVEELPFAHGRLDWSARRRLAAEWRGRFDAAYVLPNSIKAALLPFLARIPRRVGYHGEGRPWLLTERLPNPEGRPPMVSFYSALAGPVSAADAAARPVLDFPRARLDEVTAAQGLVPGAFFAFAPGAEYGPAKCWPAAHYAALAARLHRRHGQPVLLLGSAKERALCEGIAADAEAQSPGACRVVCGEVPLIDAMALIGAARGVASNDSGLMHVAAAFGVPQVALYGSTSPEHTPPLNPCARVLWLKHELALDCAPCFDRQCRFGHTRCLVEIVPERADAALADALRQRVADIPAPSTAGALPAPQPPATADPEIPLDEAVMRNALLSAGTSVWAWDIVTGALSNVDTSSALLGYPPGSMPSHQDAWNALIHPDERDANQAAYLRHARGELPTYEHEYRALARDGHWRWIGERGRIVAWTDEGEPARMVGTLSDISRRRAAEGQALEAAERLRKISRHVPGIVYQFRRRPDGRMQFPFVSDSAIDLFGLTPQSLVDDAGELLRRIDPRDLQDVRDAVELSARTLGPWHSEFRLQRADGELRWFAGASTPQAEPDGCLVWHGYLQDISERRDLEQARRERLAAQAANRAKTDFLSRVSHELRTPLNAVLGFAQLLEIDMADPLTSGQQRRVRLIRDAGEQLLRMIGDLLDLSRIEGGNLAVDAVAVSPAALVHDCANMLALSAQAAGVTLVLPRADEPSLAWADPGRLRQVLLNLLSNAVKYNRAGGTVTVRLLGVQRRLLIEVVDTGIGIAADQLPRIFEPFDRLGQQHSSIAGSGIGLAVTRALVGLMHGEIAVRSQLGQGSVFTVTLPAEAPTADQSTSLPT